MLTGCTMDLIRKGQVSGCGRWRCRHVVSASADPPSKASESDGSIPHKVRQRQSNSSIPAPSALDIGPFHLRHQGYTDPCLSYEAHGSNRTRCWGPNPTALRLMYSAYLRKPCLPLHSGRSPQSAMLTQLTTILLLQAVAAEPVAIPLRHRSTTSLHKRGFGIESVLGVFKANPSGWRTNSSIRGTPLTSRLGEWRDGPS